MIKYFNEICEFRKNNPIVKGKVIKTDDPILLDVKNSLNNLKKELENKYKNFDGINFSIEVSKGASNFPHITHICILPPNQKVSNGIYVAICFDKSGKGALVGCLESKTNPKGLNVKFRKTGKITPTIDVDGGGQNTKYNNVFENPKEFYYKLEDDAELVDHINKSLSICLYNLSLIKDSTYLQTNDYLISSVNEKEIESFTFESIKDDRKKIAVQIHLRRGQRIFRNNLIETYNKKCAVTGCEILEMLEAAHIYSYKGSDTNKIQNGLLLRSDIHTLFDLGLITINPENYLIEVSDKIIKDDYYTKLKGTKIHLPVNDKMYPDKNSLKYHFENIFIK